MLSPNSWEGPSLTETHTIAQLVPRWSPQICGVGDYARRLGEALEIDHGWKSRYLVASREWTGSGPEAPVRLNRDNQRTREGQIAAMARETKGLLVHYSSYGYAKRGAPVWLIRTLLNLRRRGRMGPLGVMFHELSYCGSWRSSSFWNWPVQRWILKQLTRLANIVVTNREPYAAQIRLWQSQDSLPVQVLPVFSNFGEPSDLPSFEDREPAMAVFGWSLPAEQVRTFRRSLSDSVEKLGVTRLIVLRQALPPEALPRIPVESFGPLPHAEVAAQLRRCRFAFLDYNPQYLGKSGLLASFAAHGLAVVLRHGAGQLPDGLDVGRHVLSAETIGQLKNGATTQAIAEELNCWYRGHDLAATARAYDRILGSLAGVRIACGHTATR